jgi:hypothetical protein
MWGIVWQYQLDYLSLYRQCERDVGLREQHPLECRLQPALIIYKGLTLFVRESIVMSDIILIFVI